MVIEASKRPQGSGLAFIVKSRISEVGVGGKGYLLSFLIIQRVQGGFLQWGD